MQAVSVRFRFIGRYFRAVKKSILDRKAKVYSTMNEEINACQEVFIYL